jgi:hypothetical protein
LPYFDPFKITNIFSWFLKKPEINPSYRMKIENKSSIIKQFIKIYMTTKKLLFAVLICLISNCFNLSAQTTVQKVNPLLFLSGSSVTVSTIGCTLSNGSNTTCYKVVSSSVPSDHTMGPWCPNNISDDATQGGIWLQNGNVYNVDGAFYKIYPLFITTTRGKCIMYQQV